MNENPFSCLLVVLLVFALTILTWILVPEYIRIRNRLDAEISQTERGGSGEGGSTTQTRTTGNASQNSGASATSIASLEPVRIVFERTLDIPLSNTTGSLYPNNAILLRHMLAYYGEDLRFDAPTPSTLSILSDNVSLLRSQNPEQWQAIGVYLNHQPVEDSLYRLFVEVEGRYVDLPDPTTTPRARRIQFERELDDHVDALAAYLEEVLSVYGDAFTRW